MSKAQTANQEDVVAKIGFTRFQSHTLTALSVLIIAGIFVLTATTAMSSRDRTLSDEMENLSKLSVVLSEHVYRIFFGADLLASTLEDITVNEGLNTTDDLRRFVKTREMYDNLKGLLNYSTDVDALGIVDSNGIVINNSRVWPPNNLDVADREYFTSIRDNPGINFSISTSIKSRATGHNIIILARRISGADESFIGVIVTCSQNKFPCFVLLQNSPVHISPVVIVFHNLT